NIGDSIVYTVNGGEEKTEKITQEIKDNGFKVEVPVTDGQKSTVKVQIADEAGNRTEGVKGEIDVDLTAPTYEATVKFDEDKDGNGKLSKAENDKDGDDKNTTATITVPSNANIGDSIVYTVNGGEEKTEKITQEIKDNGFKVEVPVT
ncbi:hypothetical protein, partial [Helicobacter pylori]|uniref:hypothetical protein n=1 Tax=Helicobacter pylori TaxID=210 RepID=UPI001BB39294